MMLIIYVLALLISFYLMAKIVDEYFVGSLDKISTKLNLSSDAAGATLMAMGSSAPELFIALIAVLKSGEHGAIGMGTIVGSAILIYLLLQVLLLWPKNQKYLGKEPFATLFSMP